MDSFNFESIFSQNDGQSHPHACIIFDALKCYRKVAFDFIRQGLRENDKCIMAVDSYHKSLISRDFAGAGLDMEANLKSGRLVMIDVRASYAGNGGFDPDSTVEIWKHESMKAISDGFNALRVVGEATFALEGPGLYEKLIYYENIINKVLFKKYPFKSLCVYDKNKYPPEVIKAAIRAHPILFYNEELFLENIHYIPPEIHFKKEKNQEEIDKWLENVRKNNKNLKELKENSERFDLALDFSNEGVWDWNLITNEIYFSPNWKKLLGYENNEIKNDFSEWESLTKPEQVPKAWKTFEEIISKKRDHFEAEFQMRHKDGRWVDILSRANVVFDADGKALRMVGTHVDITERKQAEEALRESEEKYRLLVENAYDGIYVAQDEKIKFLNPGLEKITGYSRNELMEINFSSFIHPQDREMVMGRYKRRMAGETPRIHYSFRILNKSGQELWVEINAALIQWNGRAATLNFLRDITEQKKLEIQLRQAQKMEAIGTLAGGIAHDFNNILSSVIGFTELTLDELESDSFLYRNLTEVMNAGMRAKNLVKQILTLSRQEQQEKKPVNIVPLLKEALKMLRSTMPTSIEIKQNISSQNLIVYADPTQIHQLIMNLATNAVQAMEDMEGILEVRMQPVEFEHDYMNLAAGAYVKISVSDTGVGIPDIVKGKIFEPYFTTKDKGHGTGLGLSVVHGIVKSHNGYIDVYSEPGAGTIFHVYLPRAETCLAELQGKTPGLLPTGTESILIVDDEVPIVKMHQQSLGRLGYKTTAKSSSVEALEAFQASPDKYDLIITDMTMPRMTGEKLARAVKDIRPDIPVILCTGFSERVEKHEKELAIDGILMKPTDKKEMAETVRRLIDRSSSLK